jgi:hypothetical protein
MFADRGRFREYSECVLRPDLKHEAAKPVGGQPGADEGHLLMVLPEGGHPLVEHVVALNVPSEVVAGHGWISRIQVHVERSHNGTGWSVKSKRTLEVESVYGQTAFRVARGGVVNLGPEAEPSHVAGPPHLNEWFTDDAAEDLFD